MMRDVLCVSDCEVVSFPSLSGQASDLVGHLGRQTSLPAGDWLWRFTQELLARS